jgi:hypothetical protein
MLAMTRARVSAGTAGPTVLFCFRNYMFEQAKAMRQALHK